MLGFCYNNLIKFIPVSIALLILIFNVSEIRKHGNISKMSFPNHPSNSIWHFEIKGGCIELSNSGSISKPPGTAGSIILNIIGENTRPQIFWWERPRKKSPSEKDFEEIERFAQKDAEIHLAKHHIWFEVNGYFLKFNLSFCW